LAEDKPSPKPHLYLGTDLTPAQYYAQHPDAYDNPHAAGIARVLVELRLPEVDSVLDLGCGDGLVTKFLRAERAVTCVGVDRAAGMVARYEKETGCAGRVACFDEALPPAELVVSSYALHLATPVEAASMWWRMWETGAAWVAVVTPFKARPADPTHYFGLKRVVQGPWGPDGKTVYGRLYQRRATTDEAV
jgi:trans-aconitate methyltransferase